ncbi:MAG TPA: hypothetical protein VJ124_12130 [Pyrinomonadaceae bacterium]|nr:hypothetical protein [Pyrinomonadaceae bacterium]
MLNDIIGLGIVAFVLVCALFGLARLTRPYEVTPEEFEKRAHEVPSLLSAGLTGLQKLLDPAAGKAMEVQEDFKQGYYDGQQESGDGPEAGDAEGNLADADRRT